MIRDDFPETEIYKTMGLRCLDVKELPWELSVRWEVSGKNFSCTARGGSPDDALTNLRFKLAMTAQQYIDLADSLGWLGGYNIK